MTKNLVIGGINKTRFLMNEGPFLAPQQCCHDYFSGRYRLLGCLDFPAFVSKHFSFLVISFERTCKNVARNELQEVEPGCIFLYCFIGRPYLVCVDL